jgi:hypothetical protein
LKKDYHLPSGCAVNPNDNAKSPIEKGDYQMNVLVVEPMKKPYLKDIDSGLHSLQHEVGGYIEAIYPYEDLVALVCNA